jgi:hypothetical protein
MNSPALREQYRSRFDPVSELDNPAPGSRDFRFDDDLIVVASGGQVAAIYLGHGEINLFFLFKVAISESAFSAEIGTAHFHPNEVIRVIDHTHLVRFGVPDAKVGF